VHYGELLDVDNAGLNVNLDHGRHHSVGPGDGGWDEVVGLSAARVHAFRQASPRAGRGCSVEVAQTHAPRGHASGADHTAHHLEILGPDLQNFGGDLAQPLLQTLSSKVDGSPSGDRVREAKVPTPYGTSEVSPALNSTLSGSIPNKSATTCDMVVSRPWP
jgi:hypothetical protein